MEAMTQEEVPVMEELRQAELAMRTRRAGLSPVDLQRTLENFHAHTQEAKAVLELCRSFATKLSPQDSVGLLLYGPAGVGKSHLAAGIVQVLLRRGISCRKVMLADVLASGRSSFNEEEVGEILDELGEYRVLWLDDLTTDHIASAFESKRAAEVLFRLLDRAILNRQILIVTTNHTVDELHAKLAEIDGSDRIYDRIRELVYPVAVPGTSYRTRALAARTPEWMKEAMLGLTQGKGKKMTPTS